MPNDDMERAKLRDELVAQARYGRRADGGVDWGRAEQRWRAANNPVTILVLLFNIIVWYLVITVRGVSSADLDGWGYAMLGLSLASIAWPVIRSIRGHRPAFIDMHVARGMSAADAEALYQKTFPSD